MPTSPKTGCCTDGSKDMSEMSRVGLYLYGIFNKACQHRLIKTFGHFVDLLKKKEKEEYVPFKNK